MPSSASRARSVCDTAELDWCNAAAARVNAALFGDGDHDGEPSEIH